MLNGTATMNNRLRWPFKVEMPDQEMEPVEWDSSHSSNTTPSLTTTFTSRTTSSNQQTLSDSYKMAAEVAVGAAIIIALVILLALIWNSIKRRIRGANNPGGLPSSSTSASRSRRYSVDSLERLVEDRLRNRPPPYSPDQDKPPSYEDSFQDPSSRHPSPAADQRRAERYRPRHPDQAVASSRSHRGRAGPASISPPPYQPPASLTSGPQINVSSSGRTSSNESSSTARIVVSYENRAFDENESSTDIPSISMTVQHASLDPINNVVDDDDNQVTMLHL